MDGQEGNFIRGIVEGFYGRPWTAEQRKELFRKMPEFGLTSYMYAPKDDYKHRTNWREAYSSDECAELQALIQAAAQQHIAFFYTLSPGVDMLYSSQRDRQALRNKFAQVAALGCRCFALLFDDIEPQLQPADRLVFASFAAAHVAVANELFDALGRPVFAFCPTEYCAARAVPSVTTSEYLHCVGQNLQPEIDIMWTGPQVISKTITVESLQELASVIRRKPVIWDNLHANDYGQRRLFLGPYSRDPAIVPCIRGVFTNPNCQLEVNFNAFYTLGLWIKCGLTAISGEIDDDNNDSGTTYEPRAALMLASNAWLKEFQQCQRVPNDYSLAAQAKLNDIGLVNTAASETKSNLIDVEPMDLQGKMDVVERRAAEDDDDLMRSAGSDEMSNGKDAGKNHLPADTERRNDDIQHTGRDWNADEEMGDPDENKVTAADLLLLADLFYLPFDHGVQAMKLLDDFRWLRRHAGWMTASQRGGHQQQQRKPGRMDAEWQQRASGFDEHYGHINRMCLRISNSVNRNLVYELFPYFWDLKGMLSLLSAFVRWLGSASQESSPFAEEIQESWIRRGGLYAEFQRLLPLEIYTIRPYLPDDKAEVYDICRESSSSPSNLVDTMERYPDVLGDYTLGCFLHSLRDYCFVIEDDSGAVCGYIVCTTDARSLHNTELCFREDLRKKYPLDADPVEPVGALPDYVYRDYPGQLRLGVRSNVNEADVVRRLVSFALNTLEINGAAAAHALVERAGPAHVQEMMGNMGFETMPPEEQNLKNFVLMARSGNV
ncbi:protein O-GlcNAcase-like [Paramacrobiotus metropolitanus]|uniref:protein O-GlcNAcase-like n=1 Tax=Paramacrobiotus metropolitanus TaxID=2943436 RepID=UPI002445A79D|nr:protein O-GlcNAcase-like [Paramacrobiotus metropolitanus]